MLRKLVNLICGNIAVDLGTANTLVHVEGRGVVVNEPSYIAIQTSAQNTRRVVAIGASAKAMLGRTPDGVTSIRPIRDGVIADFSATEAMIRLLMVRGVGRTSLFRPRVAVCVPSGITDVEKRALRESLEQAGSAEIHLFSEPLAAAVGAGLPVTEPTGSMIVDIGGGTTEVAIIALSGVVRSESIGMAGDKLDDTIMNFLRRSHHIIIGDQTAEKIKTSVGAAIVSSENRKVTINGRDTATALPKTVEIAEEEIVEAIREPLKEVIEVIKRVLENAPPELVSDVTEHGITLAGGGALIKNLDQLVARETGLPVMIAEDPMSCCVVGCGEMLRKLGDFPEIAT